MEKVATGTFDRFDIEICDVQCQSGWTWQLLTCCDARVCSLTDNPSVLHNKHKPTTGHTVLSFSLFLSLSYIKYTHVGKQTRTHAFLHTH